MPFDGHVTRTLRADRTRDACRAITTALESEQHQSAGAARPASSIGSLEDAAPSPPSTAVRRHDPMRGFQDTTECGPALSSRIGESGPHRARHARRVAARSERLALGAPGCERSRDSVRAEDSSVRCMRGIQQGAWRELAPAHHERQHEVKSQPSEDEANRPQHDGRAERAPRKGGEPPTWSGEQRDSSFKRSLPRGRFRRRFGSCRTAGRMPHRCRDPGSSGP